MAAISRTRRRMVPPPIGSALYTGSPQQRFAVGPCRQPWWCRSCPVGRTVGLKPSHRAIRLPPYRPSVLVHQLVMKRAYQEEVVEIGGPPMLPPLDVVGLG